MAPNIPFLSFPHLFKNLLTSCELKRFWQEESASKEYIEYKYASESENSLWIDCGTPDALVEASHLAEQGVLSPEPCNYRDGDSAIN